MSTTEIKFDGGSQPNPGPSAIGYIVKSNSWEEEGSAHIGKSTNNKAEYNALIQALNLAVENECDHIIAKGDSELIVKQVKGEYDVNDAGLRELHDRVQTLVEEFESFEIEHISREENSEADSLVDNAFSQ
ncbi:ribonuclease HI family protein [Halorubrum sp. GN11_10-6_MGM]|uniref:ribonuclease HI family protein n=1 Tax=Halorubrum sp. GN11_10-6_MGM TaxID=2518112 RepID=UPI0010F57222|nr:ribonuclease HI family protein [Halorubrum sp. GN11_10-6_MGM]TKX72342.1 ribonuclease HI family protein [Halorubrum sp. GN11_10-6_MGM]